MKIKNMQKQSRLADNKTKGPGIEHIQIIIRKMNMYKGRGRLREKITKLNSWIWQNKKKKKEFYLRLG